MLRLHYSGSYAYSMWRSIGLPFHSFPTVYCKDPSSVKELIKAKYLCKDSSGILALTSQGEQVATAVYERHCFFTEKLSIKSRVSFKKDKKQLLNAVDFLIHSTLLLARLCGRHTGGWRHPLLQNIIMG